MQDPSVRVAVVMERREIDNKWATEEWVAVAVIPDTGSGGPSLIAEDRGRARWLHPGYDVTLRRDEAEGYFLNVTTDEPRFFVMWQMEADQAVPHVVSASYNEASTWMDAGDQVDPVPIPPELLLWLGDYVRDNYRPEPKKRIRPRSFMHPKDRAKG
ncbi:MAG: DUF3305 domain-containing protein [Gammaproteobacteria bacterium]|nr:DUF3305 domain-containing protein [Gammaproteobacteria bacterium]